MVFPRWDYNLQWRLEHCYFSSYPIAGSGQRVIEAAKRCDSIKISDGDQLLTVGLLKGERLLCAFLKQVLQKGRFCL